MFLFDHGNTAAAACDDDLSGVGEEADRFDFHDIYGLRSGDRATEAFARLFYDVIAFFDFCFRIIPGHIAPDNLGRFVKRFVVGVYRYLCQDCADRPGNPAA